MLALSKQFELKTMQLGFSLIEVIIALAVMTAGAFALMKLSTFGFKSQKSIEQASELNSLGTLLQQLLMPKDSCEMNLAGKNGGTAIQFDTSSSMFDPTASGGNAKLQKKDLVIYWPGPGVTLGSVFLSAPPTATSPDLPQYHFSNWNLNPQNSAAPTLAGMGIRILAQVSNLPPTYLIRVELNLTKNQNTGIGRQTAQRGSYDIAVTTTGASAVKTATGCGVGGATSLNIQGPSNTVFVVCDGNNFVNVDCPAGYQVSGCSAWTGAITNPAGSYRSLTGCTGVCGGGGANNLAVQASCIKLQ